MLLTIMFVNCNNSSSAFWEDIKLDNNQIYVVYRGTNSKEGFFAREFNIKDTLSSHVGLLIKDKTNWMIHHVLDLKDESSDYRIQMVEDFFNIEKEDISSGSLWVVNGLDSLKKKKLLKELDKYESIRVSFDRNFSLRDSTKLYCSEFIYKVLNNVDSVKFDFKTSKRRLSGIYKTYLRKDTLEYYPVDIFQNNENIVKIKEWYFN